MSIYFVTTEHPTGHRSKGYTRDNTGDAGKVMAAVRDQLRHLQYVGHKVQMFMDGILVEEERIQ